MSDNTATQQPKLEARIREACRVRHYSLSTERAYVLWYKQFVRWSGMKHPATLGGDRVEAWLSHLATERDVSASAITISRLTPKRCRRPPIMPAIMNAALRS